MYKTHFMALPHSFKEKKTLLNSSQLNSANSSLQSKTERQDSRSMSQFNYSKPMLFAQQRKDSIDNVY